MKELYLEDFAPGQTFGVEFDGEFVAGARLTGKITPTKVDPEVAKSQQPYSGKAFEIEVDRIEPMRLLVESDFKPAGGIVGAGIEDFRWPRPVRPGDELRVESEVLEMRPSRSRPDQGLIKVRTTALNQDGEAVLIYVGNLIVRARPR